MREWKVIFEDHNSKGSFDGSEPRDFELGEWVIEAETAEEAVEAYRDYLKDDCWWKQTGENEFFNETELGFSGHIILRAEAE